MKLRQIALPTILLVVAATALAGNQAPTQTKGMTFDVVQQNNLGAQIAVMEGHDFRGRRITFAPGAEIVEHSHAERPGIVYVISGSVIEFRNGKKITYTAGDSWIETADTNHWAKNGSKTEEAVIFMVDLPPKK